MARGDGTIRIALVGDETRLNRSLDRAGSKLSSVGGKLTGTLTPAAAAVGFAFKKAFDEWHAGNEALISGTGATGQALQGLQDTVAGVGRSVATDLGTAGEAVANLNTLTGATGGTLEDLTESVLKASKALGEDGAANSEAFGKALRQWQIPAEDGQKHLDHLFALSQEYGIGLGELIGQLNEYGAVLQNAGFSLEETAELQARLSSAGISWSRISPALNMAFRRWAEAGKEPRKELARIVDRIANTESKTKALKIATQAFGAEGAQRMVTAIRQSSFSLEELGGSLDEAGGSIDDAHARTETLGDQLQRLRNRVVSAVGPFGEIGAAAASGVAAIGPFVFGLGTLSTALKGSAVASRIASVAMRSIPFIAIAAAVIALVVVIVKNWDTIVAATKKAWGAVTRFTTRAWNAIVRFLKNNWDKILAVVLGPLGILVGLIIKNWDRIVSFTRNTWNRVVRTVRSGINRVVRFVRGLPGAIQRVFRGAGQWLVRFGRRIIGGLWNGLRDRWRAIRRWFGNIFDNLPGFVKNILGISSPSAIFFDIGRQIMEGLREGIQSKVGDIRSLLSGAVGGGSSAQNMAIGQRMAAGLGWVGAQWRALRELWTRESGWRHTATNPTSGAYGIPQSLPASKMASAGPDWRTNPVTQIRWGLSYIAGRYGSPAAALAWHNRHNWYGHGLEGGIFTRPTLIGVGDRGAEQVDVTPLRGGRGRGREVHYHLTVTGVPIDRFDERTAMRLFRRMETLAGEA